MQKAEQPSQFATLDGMRGIGALMVVIGHTSGFWNIFNLPLGHVCVDMFFILSGFVIAYAYEPKIAAGMDVRAFMLQRVIRLFPLYLLGLVIGMSIKAISLIGGASYTASELMWQFLAELFMMPSAPIAGWDFLYFLNVPAWSLLFELWANLVFILIWPILSTRVLVGVTIFFACFLTACAASYGTINGGGTWGTFIGGFGRAGFGFFCGVLIYRVAGRPRAAGSKTSWWAFPLIATAPIVSFAPAFIGTGIWIELTLVCLIAPVLIYLGQKLQPPQWATKLFIWLGAVSYAIYMIHIPIFEYFVRLAWRFPQIDHDWTPWTGLVVLVVITALGAAAERYYDQPMRAWLNGLVRTYKARKKAAAAAATKTPPAPANTIDPETRADARQDIQVAS